MIVILADRTDIEDWMDAGLPVLRAAFRQGAAGLMVSRAARRPRLRRDEYAPPVANPVRHSDIMLRTATHLTLGAGLPAIGNYEAHTAFDVREHLYGLVASRIYNRISGITPPRSGIIGLGIGTSLDSAKSVWKARPGALGTLLQANGVRSSVLGNSDCGGEPVRLGSLVAMNEQWHAPRGVVSKNSKTIIRTTGAVSPFTLQDYKTLFRKQAPSADFLIVEFGDTACAANEASAPPYITNAPAMRRGMRRLDVFLKFVLENVDLKATQVILISPTPEPEAFSKRRTLTPVLVLGAGVPRRPGILYSRSTRRPGLVLNTDFAPYVCAWFGITPPPDFAGDPFSFLPKKNPEKFLSQFETTAAFTASRAGTLRNSALAHAILFLLCLAALSWREGRILKNSRLLHVALSLMPYLFFSFIAIAGFPRLHTDFGFPLGIVLFCLLPAVAARLLPRTESRILFLCALYVVTLSLDLVSGAPLIRNSIMGYYPQNGARFYGIGNELAGFFVSGPILFFGILLDMRPSWSSALKKIMLLVFPVFVVLVGGPMFGADFGCMIACAAGYLAMIIFVFMNGRVSWKHAAAAGALVVAAAVAFALLDAFILKSHTHVGNLVKRIFEQGGAGEFMKIIFRKLAVNLKMLRVFVWSSMFFTGLLAFIVFLRFPAPNMRALAAKYPNFRFAFPACLIGALAAVAFNDSGLIAAAVSFMPPLTALFLLGSQRENT